MLRNRADRIRTYATDEASRLDGEVEFAAGCLGGGPPAVAVDHVEVDEGVGRRHQRLQVGNHLVVPKWSFCPNGERILQLQRRPVLLGHRGQTTGVAADLAAEVGVKLIVDRGQLEVHLFGAWKAVQREKHGAVELDDQVRAEGEPAIRFRRR